MTSRRTAQCGALNSSKTIDNAKEIIFLCCHRGLQASHIKAVPAKPASQIPSDAKVVMEKKAKICG